MMKIQVNGEDYEAPEGLDLPALLAAMGVAPTRVATLVNNQVVARDDRAGVSLNPGDRVEVLAFAGGG